MKPLYIITPILMIFSIGAYAQTLKGTVTEAGSGSKMSDVFVRDAATKKVAITDKDGQFEISTETGHTIIFESPGYTSDTLYLINMKPQKIKMSAQTIALREVSIHATHQAFDPHAEYPEVYQRAKVYVLSPTSWFSKDSRDARRLKKYFVREAQERHVDSVFNSAYVASLVPLRGQDLENFMTLYRPTYAFLRSNTGESLAVYVNDSYKKYEALPPDKRSIQGLPTGVAKADLGN